MDSIAICVTLHSRSQSANFSKSRVNVPNRRFSFRTLPFASAHNTQAVTLFLCTSKPQQHGYITSIARSFLPRGAGRPQEKHSPTRALQAADATICCASQRPDHTRTRALKRARVRRSLSPRGSRQHPPHRAPFHPSLWPCKDHELLVPQRFGRIQSRRALRRQQSKPDPHGE